METTYVGMNQTKEGTNERAKDIGIVIYLYTYGPLADKVTHGFSQLSVCQFKHMCVELKKF